MIICGYAGVGKTYLGSKYRNVLDLESSDYRWANKGMVDGLSAEGRKGLPDKISNEDWPDNYMTDIIKMNEEYDFVLVALDISILAEMPFLKIPYLIVFPDLELKQEYVQRCIQRGNGEKFIRFIEWSFEPSIRYYMQLNCDKIILDKGEYLENALLERGYRLLLRDKPSKKK